MFYAYNSFAKLTKILEMAGYLRFREILEMLEEDDSIEASSIAVQLPESATGPVSDEDSGKEYGGRVQNLLSYMLRALAF